MNIYTLMISSAKLHKISETKTNIWKKMKMKVWITAFLSAALQKSIIIQFFAEKFGSLNVFLYFCPII